MRVSGGTYPITEGWRNSMDIDKLVWAVEDYKREVKSNNLALSTNLPIEQRNQYEGLNKEAKRKLESVVNEYVDERVRAVLKELGISPA
jgi:hypothetical protein